MEKDPANYGLITYVWVILLSIWGGFVNFYRKVKLGKSKPFNIMELVGELATSAFAGVLTFLLCEYANIAPLMTAALVGISGHMGSRTIALMEHWAAEKFGKIDDGE